METAVTKRSFPQRAKKLALNLFPYLALIIVFVFFAIASGGRLFTPFNLKSIFNQTVILLIGSLGMIFLFAQGAFDISFGSNICFSSLLSAVLAESLNAPIIYIIGPLVFCTLIGLLNGVLYAYSGIMVFIQTMAVSFVLKGTYTTLLGGRAVISVPPFMMDMDGLPFYLIVLAAMSAVIIYLFNFTTVGKHSKMYGAGQIATVQSGVSVPRIKILSFLIAGITAGIVAVLLMIRGGNVSNSNGSNFEFNVMIALTLGGMPAEGGTAAKIRSAFIGCILTAILANGMVLLQVSARLQEVIKGVLFILVLILTIKAREKATGQS